MKTKNLPLSNNVEDRRKGGPALNKPLLTLNEQAELASFYRPVEDSSLAKDAGVDDVGSSPQKKEQ
jgi:hypothetical protein